MATTSKEPLPATIQQSMDEKTKRIAASIRPTSEELDERLVALDRNRHLLALQAQLGARYSYKRCSLESFKPTNDKQRQVIDKLKVFDVESGRGLIFYGTIGTGKDHLLAAMLYKVAATKPASWINGPELFGRFRDSFDDDTKESQIIERLVRPAVLGISDPIPIIGESGSWRTEILYRVVDMRYRDLKPTWMTINAESPEDADVKLASPVFDRLREDAELISCFWESYREKS
jgi:DNA replication protein DnaC